MGRLLLFAVFLLFAGSACGTDGASTVTESETGRVVGQPVDVEAFEVDVTAEATAVFVVAGTLPSPCHEVIAGFEEPDEDGVMVGTTESWPDPVCTLDGGAAPFSVSLKLTDLTAGEYVARLDGAFGARFSIPERVGDDPTTQTSLRPGLHTGPPEPPSAA